MVTTTRPMSKDLLPMHNIDNQPTTRTLRRLSHGLVMDLKQAVQLEKQELKKMGLSIDVDAAQLKVASPEEDNQSQECSTPPHWLYPHVNTGQYGGCPPCSPPVPIPQHHEAQHRYSTTGNLGEHLIHGEQLQPMSTSQCEARLCDEFSNYQLSFECQESFEASTGQLKESSRTNDQLVDRTVKTALLNCRSASSMTSTAESVNEDDEDLDDMVMPEEDEHVLHYGDVFVMEDL